MTQAAAPKVPWLISFQQKDLLTACWGGEKEANLLYHFLNKASWEAKNAGQKSCKVIAFKEEHEKILKLVPMAEGTLIKYLKRFNLAGYVSSGRYGNTFTVNVEAIQTAFTNPPEKPLSAPRGRPKGFKVSRINKTKKGETSENNTETSRIIEENGEVSRINEHEEVSRLNEKVLSLEFEVLSLKEKVLNLELLVLNLKLSKTDESALEAPGEAKVLLQNALEMIQTDLEIRGTYSAREDDEHSQPGAHAQPPARTLENTPYVPDSHSQSPAEDTHDTNHHGPSDHRSPAPAADHRVAAGDPAEHSGARAQAPGAPASDGADQGHAGATGRAAGIAGETRSHGSAQGASAGGSGYQKPVQATLAGTSQQESARRGPVDVSTLTIKAHSNYCFKWLDAVRQKAEEDPQASYVQSRSAEKLVRELIEATMNTANELTERNVYIAWMAMWKAPAGKDGFTWSEPGKISVAAFCRNYGEYLARGRASLAKSAQSKSSQTPTNETVSGLPRWVPPSAPAYAG